MSIEISAEVSLSIEYGELEIESTEAGHNDEQWRIVGRSGDIVNYRRDD